MATLSDDFSCTISSFGALPSSLRQGDCTQSAIHPWAWHYLSSIISMLLLLFFLDPKMMMILFCLRQLGSQRHPAAITEDIITGLCLWERLINHRKEFFEPGRSSVCANETKTSSAGFHLFRLPTEEESHIFISR